MSSTHPTLPFAEAELQQGETEAALTFDDLTEDLDPSSAFSDDEKATIRERLLATPGGPILESRDEMREAWDNEDEDFEASQSFDDWAGDRQRGSSSDDQLVRIRFTGSNGTLMTREFKRDDSGDLVAVHDYFKAGRTGGGLAKDVMRASMDEYKKLGIDKVTVHANIDVGGYAWAKFGFRSDDAEGELDGWIRDAHRNGKITSAERQMLEDVATDHAGEDTILWAISDTKSSTRLDDKGEPVKSAQPCCWGPIGMGNFACLMPRRWRARTSTSRSQTSHEGGAAAAVRGG